MNLPYEKPLETRVECLKDEISCMNSSISLESAIFDDDDDDWQTVHDTDNIT